MLSFTKLRDSNAPRRHKMSSSNFGIADKVSSALMAIDRDFVVTYVNQPTRDLLKKNQEAFRAQWPSFDADKIVGTCIDAFHKDPSHQRKMLADPSSLPVSAGYLSAN